MFRLWLVWPTYCRLLVLHDSWKIPHLLWDGVRWSLGVLIKLAMVLRHLYAILMFVFLNIFVTLCICGDMYVNVAHLILLSCGVCFVVLHSDILVYVLLWVGNRFLGDVKDC